MVTSLASRLCTRLFAAAVATAAVLGGAGAASAQVTAGPITNPANGHRYWIIQIANFADYQLASQNLGGYPVVINNAAENQWIWQNMMPLVPSAFYDYAFIGYTDEGREGEWRAMAGVADRYTNWNSGEPNDGNGFGPSEDYATMRRQFGNWNDLPAIQPPSGNPLPYAIVEANPIGSQPTGIQLGPICNPINGSTYYVLTTTNYDGGRQFAIDNLGGRPATINNADENDWIARNILQNPGLGSLVFIGLTDRVTEGQFVWDSGDGSTYRRWASTEPNNAGNEDFVGLATGAGSSFATWFDMNDSPRTMLIEVKPPCPGDFNKNGTLNPQDIFDFLNAWFSGCP